MKHLLLTVLLSFFVTSVFAAEVDTDCPAMNENREKIFKPVKDSSKGKAGTVQQ